MFKDLSLEIPANPLNGHIKITVNQVDFYIYSYDYLSKEDNESIRSSRSNSSGERNPTKSVKSSENITNSIEKTKSSVSKVKKL